MKGMQSVRDIDTALERIHTRLDFKHGLLSDELEEQRMSIAHINPTDRVLELGGNVGRNSCIIASLLDDSSNLLVLESNESTAALLADNRDANTFRFSIEAKALSKRPLMQHGWDTRPYLGILPRGEWTCVKTITWESLVKKHGNFDTLVCDCEGALYHILVDEPDMIRTFTTVIIENDFHDISHKEYVDTKFREHGLECVFRKAGGWGPCKDRFYEVWHHRQPLTHPHDSNSSSLT